MSNDNVFKLIQPGAFDDQLTEILRQGARTLLAQVVEVVNSSANVRAAVWELQTPSAWHNTFRRLFGAILGSGVLASLMLPLRRTISLHTRRPIP